MSGLMTAIGVVQAVDGDVFWMWLCFAAVALVAASFYSFHRSRIGTEEQRESLPSKVDDLHRQGIALHEELSAPVQPVDHGGVYTFTSDVPEGWHEKADAFDQGIRDLFIARYPALLSDYAKGANRYLQEQREKRAAAAPDPKTDSRSNTERLRDFLTVSHCQPALRVGASLEGLADARMRLGNH